MVNNLFNSECTPRVASTKILAQEAVFLCRSGVAGWIYLERFVVP